MSTTLRMPRGVDRAIITPLKKGETPWPIPSGTVPTIIAHFYDVEDPDTELFTVEAPDITSEVNSENSIEHLIRTPLVPADTSALAATITALKWEIWFTDPTEGRQRADDGTIHFDD